MTTKGKPKGKARVARGAPELAAPDPVAFLIDAARTNYAAFISAVHRPRYRHSAFSAKVCREVDKFVDDLLAAKRPVLMLTAPPQHGKLLAHSTPMLTANRGWLTHGELRVGDHVYRPDGTTTRVVALSGESACDAVMSFSDGTQLVTHSRHEWLLHRSWAKGRTARVLETKEVVARGVWAGKVGSRGSRANFQLPDVAPLAAPEAQLPLHPYALGVWLGDGTRTKPVITAHSDDRAMLDAVAACGYPQTNEWVHKTTGVLSAEFATLRGPLRALGLLNPTYRTKGGWIPKTIPDRYYTASVAQRLELLAGLLDSDGYIYPANGRVTFSTCEPELARSVARLVATFGWRATVTWFKPEMSSSGVQGKQPVAQVCFQPVLAIPCRLPRKRDAQLLDSMVRKRNVTAVAFGAFEMGRCIQVEHDDGMYLAGDTLIPTHNSSLISRCLGPYLFGRLAADLGQVRVACASYALKLARRNVRDAKGIMQTAAYRAIFPAASLVGFKGVSTSEEFDVPGGSHLQGVGVGGGITGFSVDCFAPGTLVDTDHGPIRIDQLYLHAETVKVLSHSHGALRYASIKAIGHRPATRLYRITTFGGRVLEVTGNHPIYSAGRYVPAAELTPGDVLLCAVPVAHDTVCGGLPQAAGAVPQWRTLLQQNVYGVGEAIQRAELRGVRAEDELARGETVSQLLAESAGSEDGSAAEGAGHIVSSVRRDLYVVLESRSRAVLQPGLQECSSRGPDVGGDQSELQRALREIPFTEHTVQPVAVQTRTAGNVGARRALLQDMPERKSVERAPHQREPVGQFVLQFGNAVPKLPPASAQPAHRRFHEADTVRMVEIVDGPVQVYDVQIREDECLFAGGILAHNCALIDDPTRDAMQALSPDVQDNIENWYESVILTRMQERSGVVIIGTPWSANDLLARVRRKMQGDPRFTRLSFPALNLPEETGFDPDLPLGPLVPQLHSENKLREMKATMSNMWWLSMFQQAPLAEFGAIFSRTNLQHYRKADTPAQFVQMVLSVDAAFKDGKTSDFVCIGVWGKTADNDVYLLDWRREKLAFMATASAIIDLKRKHPRATRGLIEDAANGAALIDMLKKHIPGLVGVPPVGSKEARAHAVSWVWAGGQVFLPHPDERPGIKPLVDEITSFPDTVTGHDDAVDCMTLALQALCLRSPIASLITNDILRMARQ